MYTKLASGVLNYNSGTFDNYLHHWVNATAGGRFVPGYHQPSSQHFGVDMNINYMVIFINFLLQNFEFFEKLRIVLFQE